MRPMPSASFSSALSGGSRKAALPTKAAPVTGDAQR
jgi:hypothetical protein